MPIYATFSSVSQTAIVRFALLGSLIQGLFIWSRLTGLAQFPRSRYTTKSFVKISECSYERVGWLGCRDLGNRAENFSIWTLDLGYRDETFFNKIASLSQTERTKWIISPCMNFYFGSMRIIFVTKVTKADKATIQRYNFTCTDLFLFFEFYLSRPGWNFSYLNGEQNSFR